jgi:formate-dependent nitrite reductase membrane component NrfD
MPHASHNAVRAAHEIKAGRYARHFWLGGIALGHALPLLLLFFAAFIAPLALPAAVLAMIAAIAGLYFYEYAFVMAPQEVPNS